MNESLPERPAPHTEMPERYPLLSEVILPLQAMLALRFYHRLHPDESIDELHPMDVERSIRGKAMERWLDEEGGVALSARFRAYVEDVAHASEHIDLSDVSVLDEILNAIGATGETVH
ncbi:MAG: hypothetical protein AB202_02785 [Parcubacteria bacterium C7867-007]|nr:MAG: hypothetical protein AB202_02785 [Parcubacteria bacterium C7867-007]